MKPLYTIKTVFFLFLFVNSYEQNIISGKVLDGNTNEPLAFVSVVLNNDPFSGTITDIDGKFQYRTSKKIETITCTFIGYKNLSLNLSEVADKTHLIINLYPSATELKEVKVISGENPANRIIRKVIQNKDINNPEKISSFKYGSYNKIIYDFKYDDPLIADSMSKRLDITNRGGYFFMMESVTDRKFIAPDKDEEMITGVRVSGFKNPQFAPLATDIQPFSFYKDLFTVLGINYLNPISTGSLNKYAFYLEDTLFQHADTVFIISFKPKPGKNFEALSGMLYINTNKYALQNVIAEPFEKGLIGIRIQQQYRFIDHKQWFPEQLNFELTIGLNNLKGVRLSANGKSYIYNVALFPILNKKEFSLENINMTDSASRRDSLFWQKHRMEVLDKRELITYEVIDSIGEKFQLDNKYALLEKLLQARIPAKYFDFDLTKTIVSNKYESYRVGTGIITNEKLSEFFSIGVFAGYGLKDARWKYGSELKIYFDKKNEWDLNGSYQNNLKEAGGSDLTIFNKYDFLRNYLASRFESIEQYSFSTNFRILKYAKINFHSNYTTLFPLYNYEFLPDGQSPITNYSFSNITVGVKYAYREKLIKTGDRRISAGTKFPILYFTYSKGIKGVYKSQFDYNKVEARIDGSFLLKNIGEMKIRVEGGFLDKPLPYGLLFTGNGSFRSLLSYSIKNSFQTERMYEFLSDKYLNFYFSHNFSTLLLQAKKFRPQIIIHQNMGWGSLSHPGYHKLMEFKTKEKGFFESGLQIDNVVKLKYLNMVYAGFGFGAYYRYGHYSFPKTIDNLSLKLTMTFSIK